MFHRTESGPRIFRRTLALALLLCGGLLLALGACSSDDPNTVGDGLVEVELEAAFDTLDIGTIQQFRGIPVSEPDLPLRDHEALYLGEQEGTASSIVALFDFDAALDTLGTEVLTAENITFVKLRIRILKGYTETRSVDEDSTASYARIEKQYQLYHLDAPVDTLAFPGPAPDAAGLTNENANVEPDDSIIIDMPMLSEQNFLNWVEAGGVHPFLIRQGPLSDPDLTGYSSRDNRHGASTLPATADTDHLGPVFIVGRADAEEDLVLPAFFDCSTFHEIEAEPADIADGFFLRTSLRSYPVLHFDMSSLPEDIVINRAVLAVANDSLRAFGPGESLVVSEFPVDLFGAAGDSLTLEEIDDDAYQIMGMTGLIPGSAYRLEFNITNSIQRYVNGAYDGTRGFILTAGEDFFPDYDTSTLDPDLYLNQFVFFGPNADDPILRPRLKITYSVAGPVGGAK